MALLYARAREMARDHASAVELHLLPDGGGAGGSPIGGHADARHFSDADTRGRSPVALREVVPRRALPVVCPQRRM